MDPMDRLKEGVKWMWSLGDYAEVAALLEPYAISLVDSCDVRPGTRRNRFLGAHQRSARTSASSPHSKGAGGSIGARDE
jgi:hypothetical protein